MHYRVLPDAAHAASPAHGSPAPADAFRFYVPGTEEGWRWAFHTCSGFTLDVPHDVQSKT